MKFIELAPGVDPEIHDGRGIMARVLAGLGGISGQPGLNDLFVEVAVPPRYYGRSADFSLNQGQTKYVDVPLSPSVLGADAGVQTARVALSSRSRGSLDSKDFPGAVTILPAPTAPPVTPGTATLIAYTGSGGGLYLRYAKPEDLTRALAAGWRKAVLNVDYSPGDEVGVPYWGTGDFGYSQAVSAPTFTAVNTVQALPSAAPSSGAAWALSIEQASTMSELDKVRSQFEEAYVSNQIDAATYQALYRQYFDRSNALQGTTSPTQVAATQTQAAPETVTTPPPAQAVPGQVGWALRISQAATLDDLAAIYAEIQAAHQSGQIDDATYTGFYNQYRAQFSNLSGAAASAPTTTTPAPTTTAPTTPKISAESFSTNIAVASSVADLESVRAAFENAYISSQIDPTTYQSLYRAYFDRLAQLTGTTEAAPTAPPTPETSQALAPSGSSASFSTRLEQATTRAELDAIKAEFEALYTSGQMDQALYYALYDIYNEAWYKLSQ